MCVCVGGAPINPICFAPKTSAPSNTPSALPRLSDGKRGPPKSPETGWVDGGSWRGDNPEGMPKGTGGSDTMLPLRGPRRGSRPFLPRHNRGGPTRHLGALCGGRPPPRPLLSVPHRIMDPLCVLGWTRTLWRRKNRCLSVRRDRPRKGMGRSGWLERGSVPHRSIGLARPPRHRRYSQRCWGGGKKSLLGTRGRAAW